MALSKDEWISAEDEEVGSRGAGFGEDGEDGIKIMGLLVADGCGSEPVGL
jgi:hypothetical protein